MADINVLTDRIIQEAQAEAKLILDQARAQADQIVKDGQALSVKKSKEILKRGDKEAESIRERLRSGALLKSRDNQLKVKQELITKVFTETLESLKNLSEQDYINYIKKNVSESGKLKLVVTKDMVDQVKRDLPNYEVDQDRFVESGFLEVKEGIENNYTFETQLNFYKEELEGELAKILFG